MSLVNDYCRRRIVGCVFPILLVISLISFTGMAKSANVVDIGLTGDGGLAPQDTIYLSVNHEFLFLFENDIKLGAIQLNFRIYSPDSATWHWNDVGGYGPTGLGTGRACLTVAEGSRMYPPNEVWDMGGFLVVERDMDDIPPDTILFGGVGLGAGLEPGPLEQMVSMHFSALSTGTNEVGTICIDSTVLPPDGDFIFVDAYGTTFVPTIQGPFCWPVRELDECPFDADGDGFGDPGHPQNICPDDNCPLVYNPDQTDSDGDGAG
ncbi:MAG: hypothetical protein ABIE07_06170, partial [Candidatus Zixiibacteriota bacterium]